MKSFELPNSQPNVKLELIMPEAGERLDLPFFASAVSAGFPSPADDHAEKHVDLNEYLVRNPPATFLVRVRGESMQKSGILDGDLLVVDRSLEPRDEKIVVGMLDGEFTVKRIMRQGQRLFLKPENDAYDPIEITEGAHFRVWGVVTFAIHAFG